MRTIQSALLLLVVLVMSACAAPQLDVSEQQLRVGGNVLLAGALRTSQHEALQAANAVVVDLRTADEGTADAAAEFARLGVRYVNIPVGTLPVSRAQVDELRVALAGADSTPVVLHCASGNRAGMLWAALQIENGVPLAQAQEEVAPIVTKTPARAAIEKYANSRSE